ncbi:DUF2156 domain-containing protein [Salinimicrobium gaetbulicola]|uniref:DUF2156 domain-containing protein n=1 Tax=Salinimicrobium gaetbulicola TaxID=999702 RepID=A0ABW3IID7_9FLAO
MTPDEIFESYIKPYSQGCCMHYSILQPEMQYFQHEYGLISYIKKYGCYFVLADPIFKYSEKEFRVELIKKFLNKYNRVSFVQISKQFAELLNDEFNYYSTQIGNERLINIQKWKISGKRKQVIRTSCNQVAKNEINILESPLENGFDTISSNWLRTRQVKKREIKFLIRTHPYFEIDTRTFCAYDSDGNLMAYIIFDPIFENGRCVGYVPDISRSSAKFKQGIFYAIMVEAIKKFKNEGFEYLNLGLSPLILNSNSKSFESEKLRSIFKIIRKYGAKMYNYNGINYTKSRFIDESAKEKEGVTNPVYFCHKSPLPLFKITAVFKASNVI